MLEGRRTSFQARLYCPLTRLQLKPILSAKTCPAHCGNEREVMCTCKYTSDQNTITSRDLNPARVNLQCAVSQYTMSDFLFAVPFCFNKWFDKQLIIILPLLATMAFYLNYSQQYFVFLTITDISLSYHWHELNFLSSSRLWKNLMASHMTSSKSHQTHTFNFCHEISPHLSASVFSPSFSICNYIHFESVLSISFPSVFCSLTAWPSV